METLRASRLDLLQDNFLWSTGIEDTFITEPWPATGRILDEYELTDHYNRWREDLDLMASLGVKIVRYGIPWHKIQPSPNRWDWSFPDQTLEYLSKLGIQPIVDLVHYGLPPWLKGAYSNEGFPQYMTEYATQIAKRYKGDIYLYTPLNEPRITAWYCGRLGWWPPFLYGSRGFVTVMAALCRGIVETVHALQAIDTEIVPVHVDATDLYGTSDETLLEEVRRRQEVVFLALDLVSGRINEVHCLWQWLVRNGMNEEQLSWFQRNRIELPIVGINLYPMFSQKVLQRSPKGLRTRMPYASAQIVERLGRLYHERYGSPVLISETAAHDKVMGKTKRRSAWLESSTAAIHALRQQGIPLIGYTWWPMLSLIAWKYRQGRGTLEQNIAHMGLWDIDPNNFRRVPTVLVDQYRSLVASSPQPLGKLAHPSQQRMRDL